MVFDETVTFDEHVNIAHNEAAKKLVVLQKSRQFLSTTTPRTLYISSLLPQLDYCDIVYDSASAANRQKLQKNPEYCLL